MKKNCVWLSIIIFLASLNGCGFSTSAVSISEGNEIMVEENLVASALELVNNERKKVDELETNEFAIYDLDSLEIFVSAAIGGRQVITVRETETGNIFTSIVPFHTVQYFNIADQDKTITFSTDGSVVSPDQAFKTNANVISLHYETQEIVDIEFTQIWHQQNFGVLGSTKDIHQFAENCGTVNNKIVFRMEILPNMTGVAEAGTEILLNQTPYDPLGSGVYSIGFRDTPMTLSNDFIEEIKGVEGILNIETNYLESQLFSGTELLIQCEEGYHLEYFFNTDGSLQQFSDFYLSVEANV